MDEDIRNIYRQGMAAFGGIAPNYHIELWERPTIVWDFHSPLLAIQMMFSFMLVDETSSLRLCNPDRNRAAGGGKLDGIGQQVQQHLIQPGLIAEYILIGHIHHIHIQLQLLGVNLTTDDGFDVMEDKLTNPPTLRNERVGGFFRNYSK